MFNIEFHLKTRLLMKLKILHSEWHLNISSKILLNYFF